MFLIPVSALIKFVHSSVSGGFVVALAVICLLQYILHMHRMNLARREREQSHRDMSGVTMELNAARRDRSLTTQENQVLCEFLSEPDCSTALKNLLLRLAPSIEECCAACLRSRPSGWSIEQSVGLSTVHPGGLDIDKVFYPRLMRGEPIVLAGDLLQSSRLWGSLPHASRIKSRELYLFGIGSHDDLFGAFLTTGLLFPGGDWPRQLESTNRVLSAVSGSLRDRWRLESRQHELQWRDEMLSLRSVADRNFDSPLRMIGEFVEQAAAKTHADRATLFLSSRNQSPRFRALIRCGESLAGGLKEQWYQAEDRLALVAMGLGRSAHYSTGELAQAEFQGPFTVAMAVPISQEDKTIGLLVFTRRSQENFTAGQQQLATWSGSLLAELIPRVVNHAVVARQARVDALTQLDNRGSFDRQIAQELESARTSRSPLSLLLLDLDRFKLINDRYGHRGGDAVLRAAAAIVRESVQNVRVADRFLGANPFVARYGGEELAVLLPRLPIEGARRIGELICSSLAGARIDFEGEPIAVTTSIGLAGFPDHADSVDDLIASADAALYLAKTNGRNRLEVAELALTAAG